MRETNVRQRSLFLRENVPEIRVRDAARQEVMQLIAKLLAAHVLGNKKEESSNMEGIDE